MTPADLELSQLKVLLPDQPETERGIEIEFPEHAWGRLRERKEVRRFFLLGSRRREWQGRPQWKHEQNAISYEMPLQGGVTLSARAEMESDGIRLTYLVQNSSSLDYEEFQAPTCVKLYSSFYDLYLERTYVHHPEGFDLLASESPERLKMRREEWLPVRYLAPFTLPVVPVERRVERKEDGITWRHKLRKVDAPLLATLSQDRQWVAATYTYDAPNVWSNPERTCHHADPAAPLPPKGTAQLALKLYLMKGSLADVWDTIRRARAAEQAAAGGKDMQQNEKPIVTVTGELEWLSIEGGFWVLNTAGKIYDLHSDRDLLRGFKSGDRVRVRGRIRQDRACIHMRGVIFELEDIGHSSQK